MHRRSPSAAAPETASSRHGGSPASLRGNAVRRIAMFASNYPPHLGGLEVMVWQLAMGLAQRHHVTLVTSAHGGCSGVSREDGMTVHRLPANHTAEACGVPYPMPLGPGLRAALAAAHGADVVHAHGALYAQTLLAARVARRSRAPLVLTEHVGFVEYANPAVDALQRAAWRLIGDRMIAQAAAVTTYNARVQHWLGTRSGRAVQFIGNGVDVARFKPRTIEERRQARAAFGLPLTGELVLFAARASAKKRLDDVLAIPRDSFTLVVCGAERGLRGDGLIDLGVLPHARMPELYAAADLMVLPSTGEGFPLAVQEAVASGLPLVLRWDDGYGSALSRDVVLAYDTADAVGDAVRSLVTSPADRARLAASGRRWAEEAWSWQTTVESYEELYDVVIAGTIARG
ncbi:MAG: glycosyltransferase family 4 protein [Gemmatimonadaceae bacterium]